MAKADLTVERLREILNYDPDTGVFVWRVNKGPVKAGRVAGYPQEGYIGISIDGTGFAAHRLAWLYVYGQFPEYTIDHINQNKSDNRICNLRHVTHANNMLNKGMPANNRTGYAGVSWCSTHKKFVAQITANRIKHHIGWFDDPALAHAAYMAEKKKLHIVMTI